MRLSGHQDRELTSNLSAVFPAFEKFHLKYWLTVSD